MKGGKMIQNFTHRGGLHQNILAQMVIFCNR